MSQTKAATSSTQPDSGAPALLGIVSDKFKFGSSTQTNTRSDAEIAESTQRIYEQIQLLQADDIAQIGKDRKLRGDNIVTATLGYWKAVFTNIKAFVVYLVDTWFHLYYGMVTGQFSVGEAVSIFASASWTSSSLFAIFFACTFGTAPLVVWIYKLFNGKSSNGLSLVNSSNPHLFDCLTVDQSDIAKQKMGTPADARGHNPRVFDLDIAKFLLQISSLMYERDDSGVKKALEAAQKKSDEKEVGGLKLGPVDPGAVINTLFSSNDVKSILSALNASDDSPASPIRLFKEKYGVLSATASELQTTSQAYCSLYWDPRGTWIVVAFKGTDPLAFDEWMTDFTMRLEDCSDDIEGFSSVHKGFKDRILPATTRKPYDSIASAIKIVSAELVKGQAPGTKVNIWFTGHSLGTSMASLAYAKALIDKDTIGPNAVLRDGYLFATPITTDIKSRLFFNYKMKEDKKLPRTLFRITNRDDFVATGIPQFGDDRLNGFGADSAFNFTHLGVEIFMRPHPNACEMSGDEIRYPEGYGVHIKSHFTEAESKRMRADLVEKGYVLPKWFGLLQYVPLAGRFAAHCTTNYWESLELIGMKPAVERE